MSGNTANDAARRRWITFGEISAAIALIISGLTLWNNWSQRSDSEAARNAEAAAASGRAERLVLTATRDGDERLALRPVSADQAVQSQDIAFPSALNVTPASTTGEPRIDASWFASAVKKARDHQGLPDDSRGDERLPVAITTRYLVDGKPYEDVAIYDIGYGISGHWLSGHTLRLRGLSLVARVRAGQAQARIDRRWRAILAQEAPARDK